MGTSTPTGMVAAFSSQPSLLGSFNLTREGVKYAQPSLEYDYLNHLITGIEYCLNSDDVPVLKLGHESCDGARETFDVVAIPRSKRPLLQFLREENKNSFIVSFLLHNSTLNRGHQGYKAVGGCLWGGHGYFSGLFQHSGGVLRAQGDCALAHKDTSTHSPTVTIPKQHLTSVRIVMFFKKISEPSIWIQPPGATDSL